MVFYLLPDLSSQAACHNSSLSWSDRGKDCDLEIALPTTMIPYASAAKVRTATLLG